MAEMYLTSGDSRWPRMGDKMEKIMKGLLSYFNGRDDVTVVASSVKEDFGEIILDSFPKNPYMSIDSISMDRETLKPFEVLGFRKVKGGDLVSQDHQNISLLMGYVFPSGEWKIVFYSEEGDPSRMGMETKFMNEEAWANFLVRLKEEVGPQGQQMNQLVYDFVDELVGVRERIGGLLTRNITQQLSWFLKEGGMETPYQVVDALRSNTQRLIWEQSQSQK